jgi:hypothetical protein
MLIPFGILSAAGVQLAPTGAYELISTTTLGTATASVTFSSLGDYASTYKHLQIRSLAKTTVSGTGAEDLVLRLNGDTGSNYARHVFQGNGSGVTSGAATSTSYLSAGLAATNAIDAFSGGVCDVLDAYSTTKNKTVRTLTGYSGGLAFISLRSGVWVNTASITSITLSSTGGNLNIGSRFSLYGIRG